MIETEERVLFLGKPILHFTQGFIRKTLKN